MKISKEGIAPYFIKIFEKRDQLLEIGEFMSDREKITVVVNSLPEIGATSHQTYMLRSKPSQ